MLNRGSIENLPASFCRERHFHVVAVRVHHQTV